MAPATTANTTTLAMVAPAIHLEPPSPGSFIGPGPEDRATAKQHPHPITTEHVRLRRERQYVAQLNQAIDFRDGASLRAALDAYQADFPEDEQRLQQGYGVIAGCLNEPGPATRARAQRFFDEHRGSSLRRWVRRVCLES